ncbi:Ras subfamily protein [Acanthamoeba castellanii str. Neff]|uniref:Ras subfamily protein n=1 Tax=Acanthamoeba castellanii (strain ATCC 30010 / Neff) TaxID=1257118 RepID=L8GZI5_ACACF|nr:Ras subfamily protein [Acanthamoeba castellanii str. Neff]ELR18415.1 Ras subfamily protein [Acanthamoeba castellanii str. Neff]
MTGPFNVLLLGEFGAGKTSLAERVVYGRSPKDSTPAPTHSHHWTGVGVDLVDGPHVVVDLWDTAGEEQFNGGSFMNPNYFRRTHALIMAYDIASPDAERQYSHRGTSPFGIWLGCSQTNVITWFSLWRGYVSTKAPVIVVGTKQDLPPNQHKKLPFLVSGNGVPEMLGELGRLLFETYGLTSNPPSAALSGCCSLMVAPGDEHVDWLFRTADKPASSRPEIAAKQAPRRDNNYLGPAASMFFSSPKPKSGSQLSVSGVKYELSIDLLAAGRAHHVAQAIDRYAKSVFPSEAVWALPDIEFVWKSHLIRPLDYVKEMKATFGSGHDHDHYEVVPADFGAATALGRTAALWSQLYDGEPYVPDWLTPDLLAPFLAGGGDAQSAEERNSEPLPSTEGIKAPSWEEVRAGMRVVDQELVMEDAHWLPNLRRFLNVDKMEEVVQEKQMQACLDGYARFLTRKKLKDNNSDDDEDDEATYDVDVMWHAHMLHPQAYWRDCAQMGLALDHRPWPHLFPAST